MWFVLLLTIIAATALQLVAHSASLPNVKQVPQTEQPLEITATVVQGSPLYNHAPTRSDRAKAIRNHPPLVEGEEWSVVGRDETAEWLYVFWSWVPRGSFAVSDDTVQKLGVLLNQGVWLIPVGMEGNPRLLATDAYWNSWQWDPVGGAIWYHRDGVRRARASQDGISRLIMSDVMTGSVDYQIRGYLLASPVGGAVVVRAYNEDIFPLGDVYILDADGTTHYLGTQCDPYYTDAYIPFGTDAAWSPDGQYVVLKDGFVRGDGWCVRAGTAIYDRNGRVEPDLADPNDPYHQDWYRNPNFTDQVGVDTICEDAPPAVALSDHRNRCQWSPDRQWFATMPGAVDNPHLGELLIYSADGTLVRQYLVPGWPCNTFQWSPDSKWLAYGGPSGCA